MREYLFLESKVKRQIQWNGQEFQFTRVVEDKYHRGTEETATVTLSGVYHQATSYKQKTTADGSITSSKALPMILCMYEDAAKLKLGDTVKINGQDMFVTGVENIQELNVAAEVSLEVNQ